MKLGCGHDTDALDPACRLCGLVRRNPAHPLVALAARAAGVSLVCQYRGDRLRSGVVAMLNVSEEHGPMNPSKNWYECGRRAPLLMAQPRGKYVTDCGSCKTKQRCGPSCPGFAAGGEE